MTTITTLLAIVWTLLAFGIGYDYRDYHAIVQVAAQQRADMAAFKQLEVRYDAQSDQLLKLTLESQDATKTITQYVDRIVDRPVYRSDCFDDDGLRLANAALLGRASLATKPNAAVPGANAVGK